MDLDKSTIAESAGDCLTSFERFARQAACLGPRQYSLVEGQIARLSIWTSNIGAFASGRASVDHRLRDAPELREAVISLLEALNDGIEHGMFYFVRKFRLCDTWDFEGLCCNNDSETYVRAKVSIFRWMIANRWFHYAIGTLPRTIISHWKGHFTVLCIS